MAEFLLRGYNVAMPEVDVGDDIFVVEDRKATLWRIQVKTAIGRRRRYGHSGKFAVSLGQLETVKKPDLFYVLVLRVGDRWEFIIVPRRALKEFHELASIVPVAGGDLILNCRLTATAVFCSGTDLQSRRNNWSEWPVIRP
jgi:hypothetical protein